MNIIIPAAGDGKRFLEQGFSKPKPIIDVLGRPMIWHVLDQFRMNNARIFVILQEIHFRNYEKEFTELGKEFPIHYILLPKKTEGTACTVLEALQKLDLEEPCIVANSDQVVDINVQDFIEFVRDTKCEGSTITFTSSDPKWSYCKVLGGKVVEVKEKQVISNIANVGIYYFISGKVLKNSIESMIQSDFRVQEEFYLAPAYNFLLKLDQSAKILPYMIEEEMMHGLGIPEDLEKFELWKLKR